MKQELLRTLTVACELTGTDWSDAAMDFAVKTLEVHGEKALKAVQLATYKSRGRLTIAAILDELPPEPGDIDSETAWGLFPKSEDTGAWVTQRMMDAGAAAQDHIDRGDMVAARLAFVRTYEALQREQPGAQKAWWSGPAALTHEEAEAAKMAATAKAEAIGLIKRGSALPKLEQKPDPRITKMARQITSGSERTGNS